MIKHDRKSLRLEHSGPRPSIAWWACMWAERYVDVRGIDSEGVWRLNIKYQPAKSIHWKLEAVVAELLIERDVQRGVLPEPHANTFRAIRNRYQGEGLWALFLDGVLCVYRGENKPYWVSSLIRELKESEHYQKHNGTITV